MASSSPPLSSVRLLVPPLRLLMASMWQVVKQQRLQHYGMLEGLVSMVTEAVPELLTDRQRSLLLLALRAKVTLSEPRPQDRTTHLDKTHLVSMVTADEEVDQRRKSLLALSPGDRQRLLQDVFNQRFDLALQMLVSDFLSRMEQLFPVPDFKHAGSWLDAAPGGVEQCLQEVKGAELQELLTNQSVAVGPADGCGSGPDSELILSAAWTHPLLSNHMSPEAPPPQTGIQSEEGAGAEQQVEQVKEEVVVTTEEQDELIGQNEPANDRTAERGGQEAAQDQSDQSSSEATPNALLSISHNSQRVAHRCPQCDKCFIYRSQVIRHLRTNRSCGRPVSLQAPPPDDRPRPLEPAVAPPPRSHCCFQCSASFRTKAELLSHQRSHRARPSHQCSQCDRCFRSLSSLTNHRRTHRDRPGFACSRCQQLFATAGERDAHRLQHRPPDLRCSVCEQSFSCQSLLLRHLQTHSAQGATPRYDCRYCPLSFPGVTQLRIHQRSHSSRSFQCDQCPKAFSSLSGLHSHRSKHGAESRFLCPQCGKRFKTRDGLEGHLRRHSGERPYRCPYCPKDFTAVAGLNVHVRRHTGERPYECSVCGKAWPSKGDLQKHMRMHTGERPYTCLECGKAFSMSCHLKEHRRIHTGEKPYSCPDCGKCLRRKFDLKKHMLSHSSVRPHACVFCSKSYTRKTHLTRHLQTHRGQQGAPPPPGEEPPGGEHPGEEPAPDGQQ